jgi:hypothetical protein
LVVFPDISTLPRALCLPEVLYPALAGGRIAFMLALSDIAEDTEGEPLHRHHMRQNCR